jgi:S1-C subfamily serine protease
MRYTLAGFLLAACAVPARADESIPVETLKEIKAATCFVKVDIGRATTKGSGSGFLVRVDGETGYVVTNHHVVVPPSDLKITVKGVELVFNSGQKGERVVKAEVLASDPDADLAVLKISGVKDLPKPIDLSQKVELVETMGVFSFGFPFGEKLADKGNPAMTVGKGSVSSIRQNERGEAAIVQIDGELNPGNSGGPVVDGKGRLVGVAVAKIDKTHIGFAVSAEELARMLNGRPSSVDVKVVKVENGVAEVEVEVRFIDPFNKVKSAAVHYLRADKLKEKPQPDKQGVWAALDGSEKAEIKVENQKGSARLKIATEDKKSAAFAFQSAYVNGDSKQVYAEPTNRSIEFSKGVVDNPTTPGRTFEGELTVKKLAMSGAGVTRSLFFTDDGKSYCHLDAEGVVHRTALADQKEEARCEAGKKCGGMALSAEGIVVAVGGEEVWLLDAKTLEVKKKIAVKGVQYMAASPKLSTAFAAAAPGDALSVLDLKEGKSVKQYGPRDFEAKPSAGFKLAQVSPDGRYLFTLASDCLQRFRVEGQQLHFEESSPRLTNGRLEGIDFSTDSKQVCLASGGGNINVGSQPGFKPFSVHVFAAGDLSKPETTLEIGRFPIALGLDSKAGLIYAQNYEHQFIVYDSKGIKLKEALLGKRGEFVRQILVHPDGNKALVLGDSIWLVEVPKQ